MVLFKLHIIALKPGAGGIPSLLRDLNAEGIQPVVQAQILRWMILPSTLSTGHLLARNKQWSLLLGLEGDTAMPQSITSKHIDAVWTVTAGVSSASIRDYAALNARLRIPSAAQGKSTELPPAPSREEGEAKNLEMSAEMHDWISNAVPPGFAGSPVSMLNLLSFNDGKAAQYRRYGAEFSAHVGSKHGGHVKIVGRVTAIAAGGNGNSSGPEGDSGGGWDEIAYVHYPSLGSFASMLADGDYQDVNRRYRLGALRDTFILCTVEVGGDGMPLVVGDRGPRDARL